MTGLRRHGQPLGIAFAWMLALAALLSGLSLARALPEAHASAVAAASLCLPGSDDAPTEHQAHHAAGCILCPEPGFASAAGGPLSQAAVSTIPLRSVAAVEFDPPRTDEPTGAAWTFAQARGPPLV